MRIIPASEKVRAPSHVQFGQKLTDVPLGLGLGSVPELQDELMSYMDVLCGRVDPPVESPYLGLHEYANACFARAAEIEMLILYGEQEHKLARGSPHVKFRTGQLRRFLEVCKEAADLGSRRLTQESLLNEQRLDYDRR